MFRPEASALKGLTSAYGQPEARLRRSVPKKNTATGRKSTQTRAIATVSRLPFRAFVDVT